MANRLDLVKCVLKGIESAQGQYEKMSGGDWVWSGAEYWLTVHVALGLWCLVGDGQLTVEGKANEAMKAAGRRPGRTPLIIHNKRFDIVLWHRNGETQAPIEIKCQQSDKNLVVKDAKRVITALKKSEMKFGIVGYYYSRTSGKIKTAAELLESYIEKLEKKAQDLEKGEKYIKISSYRGKIHGNREDAWIAGCLLIKEKRPA